jgi:hypothetical protein
MGAASTAGTVATGSNGLFFDVNFFDAPPISQFATTIAVGMPISVLSAFTVNPGAPAQEIARLRRELEERDVRHAREIAQRERYIQQLEMTLLRNNPIPNINAAAAGSDLMPIRGFVPAQPRYPQ